MKATVMIPAHNVARFLPKSIDSALNQTCKGDYEILIVNDGSTDNTRVIAETYQARYSNIRLINQENQGVGATRNRLLEESKGEFLIGLDGDDKLSHKALERVINCFDSHPKTNIVYSDHELIDEKDNFLADRKKQEIYKHFKDIIFYCHHVGHLRSFRKSAIGETRFDPELKISEDYDFLLKLIGKIWPNISIGHIPETLYSYRINNNGISQTQYGNMRNTSKTVVEKHLKENKIYGDKEFEVVPLRVIDMNIAYWDHIVDGKSTMKPEARRILERYLRHNY